MKYIITSILLFIILFGNLSAQSIAEHKTPTIQYNNIGYIDHIETVYIENESFILDQFENDPLAEQFVVNFIVCGGLGAAVGLVAGVLAAEVTGAEESTYDSIMWGGAIAGGVVAIIKCYSNEN